MRPMFDDVVLPGVRELLAVEPIGAERFRGATPHGWPGHRVFGGLVAGQALAAAAATVSSAAAATGAAPHSFHAYFLRPGESGLPLDHTVIRVRDGRSFSTRSVDVSQTGEVIFTMLASFHRREEGDEYQLPRALDVALPDELDHAADDVLPHLRALPDVEVREVGPTEPETDGTYRSTRRMWVRVASALPDDPAVHASLLAFVSDMGVVTAARPPDAWRRSGPIMGASLDHAVWFHRPVRADDWLLYDLHSLTTAGARGLVRGVMHDAAGALRVSVTQETLLRPVREERAAAWERGPEL